MFLLFSNNKQDKKTKKIIKTKKENKPQKKIKFSNSFAKSINKYKDLLIEEEILRQEKLFVNFSNLLKTYTFQEKKFPSFFEKLVAIQNSTDYRNNDYKALNLDELINQNEILHNIINNNDEDYFKTVESFIDEDIKDYYLFKLLEHKHI